MTPEALEFCGVLLVLRVGGELCAVDFVLGHGADVDGGEGFGGVAGEVGGSEVVDGLASGFSDGCHFGFGVGLPVCELVGVDGVAQEQCVHEHPPGAIRLRDSVETFRDRPKCFGKRGGILLAMNDAVAVAANLLAEPARAAMLLELMSGRALPAGELADGCKCKSADGERASGEAG